MPASRTRLKLVRCKARSTTRPGPKIAPGWQVSTSSPAAARSVCFQKGGELGDRVGVVRRVVKNGGLFEVEAGAQIEEGGGAQGHHPTHAVGFARIQDVGGADHVDGLEVFQVLTGAAQQRRAVDGRLGALGRAQHVVGVADVALDQFDADLGQRGGFVGIANQRAHLVAALDQLLADVASGLPGGAGDEDRAGHGSRLSGVVTYRTDLVMTVNLEVGLFYIHGHDTRSLKRSSDRSRRGRHRRRRGHRPRHRGGAEGVRRAGRDLGTQPRVVCVGRRGDRRAGYHRRRPRQCRSGRRAGADRPPNSGR